MRGSTGTWLTEWKEGKSASASGYGDRSGSNGLSGVKTGTVDLGAKGGELMDRLVGLLAGNGKQTSRTYRSN